MIHRVDTSLYGVIISYRFKKALKLRYKYEMQILIAPEKLGAAIDNNSTVLDDFGFWVAVSSIIRIINSVVMQYFKKVTR